MANLVHLADAAANAEADAICALLNSGKLRLYNGAQPVTADTAIGGGNTLLCELTFNATAAAAASGGVATFNAVTADASANASGTPTFFRAVKSNGTTCVFDGTVGLVSGYDCIIDAVPIVAAATVSVTSMSYTANKG
jgi:hypothetical protein